MKSRGESSAAAGEPTPARRFRSRRFRFLGLDVQDIIKYFFGGNASIAIVILILICVFLIREAYSFFPSHHHRLQVYRQAGLEYVDYLVVQTDQHKKVVSHLYQAAQAEISASGLEQERILEAHAAALRGIHEEFIHEHERIASLAEWQEEQAARGNVAAAEKAAAQLEPLRADLLQRATAYVEGKSPLRKLRLVDKLSDEEWVPVRDSILLALSGSEDVTPELQAVIDRRDENLAVARERYAPLLAVASEADASREPMTKLWEELRSVAEKAKAEAVAFENAPARRAALLSFAERASDPAEKAKKQALADAVKLEAPDYASLCAPLYASTTRAQEAAATLTGGLGSALAQLPEPVSELAAEQMERARAEAAALDELAREIQPKVTEWRHDKPYGMGRSIVAFFTGKNWVTNSSWHDFYGIVPLFVGSLLISIVAIFVSVPFSIGAAIYVNQIAGPHEQAFIKPVIEFIGAIPSIVLGFFGIVVLGAFLENVSQYEWLQWVPGFPMASRLNILNAGLLLAFMAVPTIFTLAEDALNNVPKAFSEGSLAMGATKMQTVIGVVVPTAVSGIVAAVLLGFGRIIGETMVVLLVAGNKIAIPDFSAGLGVITQPAHTMTGIVAQEVGEVSAGSLHWRALFLVGVILFLIALVINVLAQRVIHRFQKVQG